MKKILLLMAMALPFVLISCGDDKDEPEYPNNHEWVDLGLPSGTLWATCNVGANAPEEYGDYFAWGETTPKDVYAEENYKWFKGGETWMTTKYCTDSFHGTVDNKTELEPDDDAASINWGPSWRMPTEEQLNELCQKCKWQWTKKNSVYGQLVTGPNGNTLFLPAAGDYRNMDNGDHLVNLLVGEGSWGIYWSRTLYSDNSGFAHTLYIGESWGYGCDYAYRPNGRTVRAVRVSKN